MRYELNGLLDRHVRIGVSGEEGSFSAKAALGWAAENGMTDFQIVHLVEIEPVQQQQQSADNSELRSPDAVRKAALARLPAELRHRVKQQS